MYMLLKQLCTERNKLQCFISFLIARGKLKGTSCLWLVELVFEKRYFVTVFNKTHIRYESKNGKFNAYFD